MSASERVARAPATSSRWTMPLLRIGMVDDSQRIFERFYRIPAGRWPGWSYRAIGYR